MMAAAACGTIEEPHIPTPCCAAATPHLAVLCRAVQTLHEYITDTEDLVNIKLDSHRNKLITVSVVLTALTTALGITAACTGIFGMNLDQTEWLQNRAGVFDAVTITSSAVSIVSFVLFMVWCWRRELLL